MPRKQHFALKTKHATDSIELYVCIWLSLQSETLMNIKTHLHLQISNFYFSNFYLCSSTLNEICFQSRFLCAHCAIHCGIVFYCETCCIQIFPERVIFCLLKLAFFRFWNRPIDSKSRKLIRQTDNDRLHHHRVKATFPSISDGS